MPPASTQSDLFALLAAGQTVVVPGAHAAQVLRSRHSQLVAAEVPAPGPLLSWHEWLSFLWSQLLLDGADDRVLLNRAQDEQLWRAVIAASSRETQASTALIRSQAQLAASGLRLAAAYNAVDRLRASAESSDARVFASWAEAFRERCTRERLLPAAWLEQALTRHAKDRALRLAQPVHLAGFERLSPAQNDLIRVLEIAGCTIRRHTLASDSCDAQSRLAVSVSDEREQLLFAARWIAAQAALGPATFGLVTARAEEQRPELERYLREFVAPELETVSADLSSTPWQFVAGPPLATVRMVADAVDLLRWTQQALPLTRISQLLLSPYFTFSDPLEVRSRLEAKLRSHPRLLRPEAELALVLRLVPDLAKGNAGGTSPPLLELARLAATARNGAAGPQLRPFAVWADHTRALLAAVGWPGPRTLTPSEFAAHQAWDSALDLLSTLDLVTRPIRYLTFLEHLQAETARATSGSPAPAAAVQILSLREAEALPFDHVLVLDATDTRLPSPETTHPLLSRYLQRSLEMPGSHPARTVSATREQLTALSLRCTSLHLLVPDRDAAGPLRPTRLAHDLSFPLVRASELLPPAPPRSEVPLIEVVEADALPPLPSPEVQGGARVLELQSACGFRAFADRRLLAGEAGEPSLGLNAREAGTYLHAAFPKLWAELKNSERLRSMNATERHTHIRTAVESALGPLSRATGADQPWRKAFLRLLEQRFIQLIGHWLAFELKRTPFEPLAQEQSRRITVGPLALDVRPDRVDKVADGLVYIDYKTSFKLSVEDWRGERPDAPQLPLYTLLEEPESVRGLAFAQVRPGKNMGWHSLSDTPNMFGKSGRSKSSELQEEINLWRSELTRLAQAFADGEVSTDPKLYPNTCQYCAFRTLCRLDPSTLLEMATDDDSAEVADEEPYV